MITPHNNPAELPDHINYFVGVCAIADDIAEIPNHIVLWRNGKNRFKCLEIRVNVGDYKCAHFSPAASVHSTCPRFEPIE